jgi:hypothetical protein
LMGQQSWLAGRTLRPSRWFSAQPGWDHDHCAFCHAKIAAASTEDVDFTAGYLTANDNYIWVCPPCFNDFKVEFQWDLAPPTDS